MSTIEIEMISDAIKRIEQLRVEGHRVEAWEVWSNVMATCGHIYADLISDDDKRHRDAVPMPVVTALNAITALLPDDTRFMPAHRLMDALVDLVMRLAHGNGGHPLSKARPRKIPGMIKGKSGNESHGPATEKLKAVALACWLFLEDMEHPAPSNTVAQKLRESGFKVADPTVRSWKYSANKRQMIGSNPESLMNALKADATTYGVVDHQSAIEFVGMKIREAVEMSALS